MSVQGYLEHAGPLAYVGITLASSCVPCMPMTFVNLAAGSLFGFWLGTLLFMLSATLGAVPPVLLVRGSLRPWATRKLEAYDAQVKAINSALHREGPLRMVALLRLSPAMPTTLGSYMLGMTEVDLPAFVLGTAVGLAPFSVVYVFLGAVGKDLVAGGRGGGDDREHNITVAMTVVGIAATLALMWKIAKIAQQALD
eukprot:CAMPEP_0171206750 /NCGR_PEP_ID=MMETSP0790-20130122/27222_1 /TAXON_ID=2925 /ORGANISM="Alexandrium catenella, Strain OF101" /LENGTH=196 /DNA_ID=CAMNT_0011672301 /DNA_START=31 /DNA_END=618 /DNA_ORIENTATION=-